MRRNGRYAGMCCGARELWRLVTSGELFRQRILSLIETAKRLGRCPQEWLRAVVSACIEKKTTRPGRVVVNILPRTVTAGSHGGGTGSLGYLYLLDIVEIEAEGPNLVVEVVGAKPSLTHPSLMMSTRLPPMPRMMMFWGRRSRSPNAGFVLNTSVSPVATWRSDPSVMTVMEPDTSEKPSPDALSLDHDGSRP